RIDGIDAQVEPLVAAPFDGRHAGAEALDEALAGAPAQVALALREDEEGLGRAAQVEPPAVVVDDARSGEPRRQGDAVQRLALESPGDEELAAGDLELEIGDRGLEAHEVAPFEGPEVGGRGGKLDHHL